MDANPQTLLLNIYNYLLGGVSLPFLKGNSTFVEVNNYFRDYFEKGQNQEVLKTKLFEYRGVIYSAADPDDVFLCGYIIGSYFYSLPEFILGTSDPVFRYYNGRLDKLFI